MTTREQLAATLATPEEWAGLSAEFQARYLDALNARGIWLLAERVAPGNPTRQVARWVADRLVETGTMFQRWDDDG